MPSDFLSNIPFVFTEKIVQISIISGILFYIVAIDVINDNKESTRSLVTHRYKLDDVQTAFSSAMDKSKESIKVHLQIN